MAYEYKLPKTSRTNALATKGFVEQHSPHPILGFGEVQVATDTNWSTTSTSYVVLTGSGMTLPIFDYDVTIDATFQVLLTKTTSGNAQAQIVYNIDGGSYTGLLPTLYCTYTSGWIMQSVRHQVDVVAGTELKFAIQLKSSDTSTAQISRSSTAFAPKVAWIAMRNDG